MGVWVLKLTDLKDKFTLIVVVIIFSVAYYYVAIYIPYYCFFLFELIDINKYPDLSKWSLSILTLIGSLIILMLAYVCANFAKRVFLSSPSKQTKKIIKYDLLLLSILGGVLFVAMQYMFSSFFFNEMTNQEDNNFELWYLPALITTCCTYPIAEEIFFRKGIFNLLDSEFHLIVSISLSSLLFAAIHYPNYSQMLVTGIGGVVLGLLYKKTSELIYPIVFHISWNITVVIWRFLPVF